MTDLTAFGFHGQSVRVLTDDNGDPWFVAADVAAILGYRMASDMTRRLDDDDRGTRSVRTPSGDQDMTVITEPGLYTAVLGSQVTGARTFKRWITTEVLPSIRKTGQYGVVSHLTRSDLARMVIDSESAKDAAEARVLELEPSAQAWTALADAAGDYSLRDAAQILSRDHGVQTGQNRLMDTLREWAWVDAKDIPYQRVVDAGLVRARPRTYEHQRTNVRVLAKPQIRITVKGIERIRTNLTEAS